MLIHCSKKLLDELKIKPDPELAEEPLFSWSAHVLTIQRKKMVVAVNNLNRYAVILYGLKAKDFKRLGELIKDGLREIWLAEGIKEDVIERYLSAAGEVNFTKSKDRSSVSRLNRACDFVYFLEEYIDPTTLINTELSLKVSRDLVGAGKNKYIYPYREMFKELENLTDGRIFGTEAVQLKISLKLDDHPCWRRVIVPLNNTFEELHGVIKHSFGWGYQHLHSFYLYNPKTKKKLSPNHPAYHEAGYEPILNIVGSPEALLVPVDMERRLEHHVKLSEYIPGVTHLKYVYDFGDNWEHYIEVEKAIRDYDTYHPVCLEGEGDTPPEDVGGRPGYSEYLKVINDPGHPEHREISRWAQMQGRRKFDIEMVNRLLK
ncbi:plasmid pRiA4b ORF-3 family protein [Heyndrickxia sp. MSNUG]|uniref:plasmid pRiA4b ORF-3 family protein n=1 Tax=Heyndrickxia sp. MSNUG TaxID=3136677 RepID=UPI003C2ACF08